ncbi:unnamed protein product, partial [marine sediment metagenome]
MMLGQIGWQLLKLAILVGISWSDFMIGTLLIDSIKKRDY